MNTIELLRADRHAIPTEARCEGCGARWRRRPHDLTAYGLMLFAAEHEDCAEPAELER